VDRLAVCFAVMELDTHDRVGGEGEGPVKMTGEAIRFRQH
jgi:hypothetical protein